MKPTEVKKLEDGTLEIKYENGFSGSLSGKTEDDLTMQAFVIFMMLKKEDLTNGQA